LSLSSVTERFIVPSFSRFSFSRSSLLSSSFSSCSSPTSSKTCVAERCVPTSSILLSNDENLRKFRDRSTYSASLKPVEESRSLLADTYSSPLFYELEMQTIYRKTWVCVGVTDEVKEIGDTKALTLANQPLLIIRDKKEKLRGFYNVCSHRGSLIVKNNTITNQKVLACPYHSWSYNLEGKLLGTSLFNKARRFEKIERDNEFGLVPFQIDTWGPYIFVNLNPTNTVTLKQYLGDLFDRYIHHFPQDNNEWKLARKKEYPVQSNWKNTSENFMDFYHLPWLHPTLVQTSTVDAHVIMQGPGMYMGFGTVPLTKGGSPADADFLPHVKSLTGHFSHNSAIFLHLFPNLSLFLLPHHVYSLTMIPNSVSNTTEVAHLFMQSDTTKNLSKKEADSKTDDIFNFWDSVNIEDISAVEDVQRGQKAGPYTGGPFSQFEAMIHRFQQMVVESVVTDGSYSRFFDAKASNEYNIYNEIPR